MTRNKITVILIVIATVLIPQTVAVVEMRIAAMEVVWPSTLGTSNTFTCLIQPGSDVLSILSLQILRRRESVDSSYVAVAQITAFDNNNATLISGNAADLTGRATVSGSINRNSPTSSTLLLSIPYSNITCTDKGNYSCSVSYQNGAQTTVSDMDSRTLSIYALPNDVQLTVTRTNGNTINEGSSSSDEADVDVNDVVHFSCFARIGSDNTTTIKWKRTSEIGTVDNFVQYNPSGNFSHGTPSSTLVNCRYSRTATMSYNVSVYDYNRDNNLAFQCYVSVVQPGGSTYETQDNPSFYINPVSTDSGSGSSGGSTVAEAGTNAGAIAGGVIGGLVLIVLIVLLVYFLWYRRKGDGNTYRTKEETGGSNPNMVDVGVNEVPEYATPNKERKYTRAAGNSRANGDNGTKAPLHSQPKGDELHYAELDLTGPHLPRAAPRKKSKNVPVEYAEVEFKNR